MNVSRFFPSTTGRINTWPMPASVTQDDKNGNWRKLDNPSRYLGLYNYMEIDIAIDARFY
jgi:hypothetical protein